MRLLHGIAVGLACTVAATEAQDQPFCFMCCPDQQSTLTEQLDGADVAYHARPLTNGRFSSTATTAWLFLRTIKAGAPVPAGDVREIQVSYASSKTRDIERDYVLFGNWDTTNGRIRWESREISPAAVSYLCDAPPVDPWFPEISRHERLRYFLEHLGDADECIAADAAKEIDQAKFDQLLQLSDSMPRQKFRDWLQAIETKPDCIARYGLLLGICGTPDDAQLLKAIVVRPTLEFRKDIDKLMFGYLLLAGEPGLDVLDEFKLKDSAQPFSEIYGVQGALRSMWEHGRHEIGQERLLRSMHLLLDCPDLVDLVVADLARMKDWSVQDRLVALYDDPQFKFSDESLKRSTKRAIVRYLLRSTVFEQAYPDEPEPEHTRSAKRHLAALTERDPKTVKDASRFFRASRR